MGSRRDDYDDPPRRPRRRDDDDYDDPRRRRRRSDDDDDDRPRRRPRRRRSSGGANVGKVIAIIVGSLAAVGIIIAVVLALSGSGFGGGSINYAQYETINDKDTIEGLEKKFGRGRKIDPSEWAKTVPGGNQRGAGFDDDFGGKATTLAGYNVWTNDVTAWYRWKKGKEEVYIAEGTDSNGRKGLVLKLYFNPKVIEDMVRNPNGPKPTQPWWSMEQIGVGGKFQFGGVQPSTPRP